MVPIVNGLLQFKQNYVQGNLTPDKLQAALSAAQGLVVRYQSSSSVVSSELRAAHDERASVNTDRLAPPLKNAFAEVDGALAEADRTLGPFQDVNQLVRQLIGP